MSEPRWAALAEGCVRTARSLMDRGFFDRPRTGGFALSFESGAPNIFGYVGSIATGNPQVMLLRGGNAFPAFDAAMTGSEDAIYFLDACDVLAMGFAPFKRVLSCYRPFLLAGGVEADPDQTTPFFFAEPPCSDRHGPNRDEARVLLGSLRALEIADGRTRLNLLPMGTRGGEFAVLHLSGPPEEPEVKLQTGIFGIGPGFPDAGAFSG